jgi:hypothetical protein
MQSIPGFVMQYYNYMLSTHAMQHLAYESSCLIQPGTEDLARQLDIDTDEEDNVHINYRELPAIVKFT